MLHCHIGRMRNTTALVRKRTRKWRLTMQGPITPTLRRAARWALLPAIALTALATTLPAQARDQQATAAQIDNEMNWRAVGEGFGAGAPNAYAQAYRHGRVHEDRDYR
jgi:hypothetical protein